jgi:hypothetical protein
MAGLLLLSDTIGRRVVGQAIGPNSIAIISDESAILERYCDALRPRQREIRPLQS